MAKEIERKFLIGTKPVPYKGSDRVEIKQGYILLGKNKQLRVRIYNDSKAFICIKYTGSFVRDEYEYAIPLKDAIEMYNKCKLKIEKSRYTMKKKKYTIDIDLYKDNLVVVEVEFTNEKDATEFVPLSWMGSEITGNKLYSNITLAKIKNDGTKPKQSK